MVIAGLYLAIDSIVYDFVQSINEIAFSPTVVRAIIIVVPRSLSISGANCVMPQKSPSVMSAVEP